MRLMLFAALAVLPLMGCGAHAAPASSAASSGPAQRCDKDGCWTYDCDATSNHCHRHWTSSTPRDGATATDYKPDTAHPDSLCDRNGENCAPDTAPR